MWWARPPTLQNGHHRTGAPTGRDLEVQPGQGLKHGPLRFRQIEAQFRVGVYTPAQVDGWPEQLLPRTQKVHFHYRPPSGRSARSDHACHKHLKKGEQVS